MTDDKPPFALYRSDTIEMLLTDPSPEDVVASLKAHFQITDEELTPMVVVRIPASDWEDLRSLADGTTTPPAPGIMGVMSRAIAKVAKGEVIADASDGAPARPPGTMSAPEIEAMDLKGVLARLELLKPQTTGVPLDAALPEGVMGEFLGIGRALDRWWGRRTTDTPRENEAVREARAWMYSNKLPTTYRP